MGSTLLGLKMEDWTFVSSKSLVRIAITSKQIGAQEGNVSWLLIGWSKGHTCET